MRRCLLLLVPLLCMAAVAGTPAGGCRALLDAGHYAKALAVCRPAATRGDPAAQFHLSMMYAEGWGVDKHPAESLRWLQASAGQGYPPAEYALASHLAAGAGVPRDTAASRRLLAHAADQGFLLAQMLLGRARESGYPYMGIDKDMARAIHWFRRAAAQCAACQYELWRIHYFGLGVDKDATVAARHLLKAAHGGLPKAQMQLGFRYVSGEGVPRDAVKAYMWFFIAVKGGDPLAAKALPLAARKLSRSQVAEARTMAARVMDQPIDTTQLCELYRTFCDDR